jgi:hypothetical protein
VVQTKIAAVQPAGTLTRPIRATLIRSLAMSGLNTGELWVSDVPNATGGAVKVAVAGTVEAIHISSKAGEPLESLGEVEAVAGVGLAGDRYFKGGFYSLVPTEAGAREVTLFEAEVLDYLSSDHGIELDAAEHRRNLTTRGVRLISLVGCRFRIGEALLEGIKECTRCDRLQSLVGKPVLKPLVGLGGLRARVTAGGMIRVGDTITAEGLSE